MKYTFQHYVDIQTSADSLTMIKIACGGRYVIQRCKHLIGAYKYMKLGRVSVKFLPASTLPVDPLGLSYADDDPNTIDPRDQMNPGLVRITNGEDILDDFTGLTDEQLEQMYLNTMLDPRWSKFMLQRGFKRSAVPLYWNIGQLHQDPFPGTIVNVPGKLDMPGLGQLDPEIPYVTNLIKTPTVARGDFYNGAEPVDMYGGRSDPRGLFQVGHRGRLGWMPTDALYFMQRYQNEGIQSANVPMLMSVPSVNVITCLLPKAFKTVYYYRMFITETVYFSGLKNTGLEYTSTDTTTNEIRAVDNFMHVGYPNPAMPYDRELNTPPLPWAPNDGGFDV